MTALIITIGTRDIIIDREMFTRHLRDNGRNPDDFYFRNNLLARPAGEYLFDNFDYFREYFNYPIVKPALDLIMAENEGIDMVIIIGTDQPQEVGNTYYNNDSLFFAKIVKRIISERYRIQNRNIRISLIQDNVSYLDSMYNFWQQELEKTPYTLLNDFDRIYLCNQAGIDAINIALMFHSLNKFGKKLYIISVNERTNQATKIEFTSQYLENLDKRRAERYIDNYIYAPLNSLSISDDAKKLADFAHRRLLFDFDACIGIIENLSLINNRTARDNLLLEIRDLQRDNNKKLKELYINAKIKYKQQSYVDFLLRFFRIVEDLAKNKALNYLEGFEYSPYRWRNNFEKYLAQNSELKDFLEQYSYEGGRLDYLKSSLPVFIAILEFYNDSDFEFIKKISRLAQLRNKSIGAHAFEPVSAEQIEGILRDQDRELNIERVFERLEEILEIRENPFDRINEVIKENL